MVYMKDLTGFLISWKMPSNITESQRNNNRWKVTLAVKTPKFLMSKKNYSPYFIFWADYMYVILLAPNVQKLDSAFHWGSHYLVDK